MRPNYSLETAGYFRANPHASVYNANRQLHTTKGTPATDTGTVDVTNATSIEGVKYAGVDGVEKFIQLFYEDIPTGQRRPVVLSAKADKADIQEALYRITNSHEVSGILAVTKAGEVLTITHTGAGTLSAIVVDGADVPLTRASVAGVGVATAAPAQTPDDVDPSDEVGEATAKDTPLEDAVDIDGDDYEATPVPGGVE